MLIEYLSAAFLTDSGCPYHIIAGKDPEQNDK